MNGVFLIQDKSGGLDVVCALRTDLIESAAIADTTIIANAISGRVYTSRYDNRVDCLTAWSDLREELAGHSLVKFDEADEVEDAERLYAGKGERS